MPGHSFQLLFHILQSEQSILSRTDQKAYTLLSILGVFMVFFIVYYRLLFHNVFIVGMLVVYFGAAFITIWNLVHTILPRFRRESVEHEEGNHRLDPTFFGGIREFPTSNEYFTYLKDMDLDQDEDRVLRLVSRQVHSLALINSAKNAYLRRGVYSFIIAIGAELLMIMSTFIQKGLESLSG
ncbi:MAG: hypothetical protein JSW54_02655 [Fidelibacterota bacterium]|nr:MAG: hypothetical protein JSW54_02655 [Candidatus Neomarinimicrobiota bacterium]